MQYDKNFKIWGVSYGLVGDLVMGLPVLTWLEKEYPGSYKTWVIQKKMGFMAPFFLNHPLIDRIHISEGWDKFTDNDYKESETYNVRCVMNEWKHCRPDWYNVKDCIDETATVAGIHNMKLTPLEKYPKLYQWFDVGKNVALSSYSKENIESIEKEHDNTISIFPFATAKTNTNNGRSPSLIWWRQLMYEIREMGYNVYQFGMPNDEEVEGATIFNHLTFFEQIQIALSTKMSIGTDSGNMWVMGAYSHPAIHLMTQWLQNHTQNRFALEPKNLNGSGIFAEGGVDNINIDTVVQVIRGKME